MFRPLTVLAAMTLATMPLLPISAQAAPPAPGQDLIEWCLLNGGEIIDQPPGSAIAACCTEDGCIICNADWSGCTFDPPYSRPNTGHTRFEGNDLLAPPSQGSAGPAQLTTPLLRVQ